MDINDFLFENVAFEIRYKHGYLYLDNCGKICRGLSEICPDMVSRGIDTNGANLRIEDKFIDIIFGTDNSHIVQQQVENLDEFSKISEKLISLINNYLEIDTFTRIGNRFILFFPFETIEEATEFLINTKLFSLDSDKIKYLGKTLKKTAIRLESHSEDIGCMINLKSEERKLNISLPFPGEIKAPWFKPKGVILDVDYFTIKSVDFGILKCSEFINNNFHKLKLFLREM